MIDLLWLAAGPTPPARGIFPRKPVEKPHILPR